MQLKLMAAPLALVATTSGLVIKPPVLANATLEMQKYCDTTRLETPEGAVEAWVQSGAAEELDKWVRKHGSARWLKHLAVEINPSLGSTKVDDCTVVEGTNCDPLGNNDCFSLYRDAGDDTLKRAAFWIFTGADRVKQKIDATYKMLVKEGIVSKLNIDQVDEDLGGLPDTGEDFGKWFSLALGAVSNFAGIGSGAANTGFDIFTSLLSSAIGAVDYDEVDVSDSLETTMATWLNTSFSKLEDQLGLALGAPNSEDQFSELDKYIRLGSGYPNMLVPTTQVGKFFAQAPWLIDYDEVRDEEVDKFTDNLRQKLAHEAIKAAGWKLTVISHATSEKECGNKVGHQWIKLDGNHYCTCLVRDDISLQPLEDFYNDKMAKYGLGNRVPYYENILECGLKLGTSEDADSGKLVGGYPSCWFQMDLAFTGWCGPETQEDVVDCINDLPGKGFASLPDTPSIPGFPTIST
ncbi:hypothetical protein NM208_g14498 [Fusarium decemcellulare]|uniref:Uncharacterized protein n=1 Tax=Fusarium decemcellulare TaxID=57161 RepID=A0ACC1RFV7_9HYPO|nr:hypothetical protein NM208_g14498 [Fusarium decemcellulare]